MLARHRVLILGGGFGGLYAAKSLRKAPNPTSADAPQPSTASFRLLRAHWLIRKLPHTHRYQVTGNGRLILNAILSAHRVTVQQLTAAA